VTVGLRCLVCELPLFVNLSCGIFSSWLSSSSPGCLPITCCPWAGLSIPCEILWTFSFQICQ
ncbi:hypothetical protein N301_05076, partial [Charadrius vociferus]